ncbi:MAG: twin-arginine translocase subunit TatC [Bacteroidales bacterium]
MSKTQHEQTFWEHLEDFRWVLIQSTIVLLLATVIAFFCKDLLAEIIFAPHQSEFVSYRVLCSLADALVHLCSSNWFEALCPEDFSVELLNTRLTAAFFVHMTSALYAGFVVASPFILCFLWRFISPALHANERKVGRRLLFACTVLFVVGTLLAYFVIFPLSFRFLGTYQFGDVPNRIDLSSYLDTFYMIILSVGLIFEMPMIAYSTSRIGLISKQQLRAWRKYAILAILIIGAVITPTSDPFSLMLICIPMWFLYLLSIWVSKASPE